MSVSARPLRVVLVWRGEALEERIFDKPQTITIGTRKGDTFVVPPGHVSDGFPLFVAQPESGSYTLTLTDGMAGKLSLGGDQLAVSDFLSSGRGVPSGQHRYQPLGMGDWGIVALDESGDVAFFFQFVAPGMKIHPPLGWIDKYYGQALAFSAVVHVALLVLAWIAWEPEDQLDVDPPPSAAIAKLLFDPPPEKQPEEKKDKSPRKVREEDASKKAAGKEGKIGEKDAKVEKTVIPKGPRDQIAQKVSTMGLLGALKQGKQSNSLKSLLSDTPDASVTTALAGVQGAQLQVGRGSGGMGTRGDGPGGGGTGKGQLLGTGDLAIGGGGKGARNTGNGPGRVAKELKVAATSGTPSSDGGLSKEQILKVVQSHAAAIQFCYEKELQRFPHLAGKVTVDWTVDLDGRVQTAKVGSTSLNNASAESCMVRQVKAWQFPKPNGVVCHVSFPFFFKGQ